MYHYLIYQDPKSEQSLPALYEQLKNSYSGKKSAPTELTLDAKNIKLRYNNYAFYISENQQEYINEELQDLIKDFDGKDFAGNEINRQQFSSVQKRFELYGDEDIDMNYFNESVFILEFFEQNSNYLIFETN